MLVYEKNKEEALKRIVIEIKKTDVEKQNFIMGYLEALNDLNALNVKFESKEIKKVKSEAIMDRKET